MWDILKFSFTGQKSRDELIFYRGFFAVKYICRRIDGSNFGISEI